MRDCMKYLAFCIALAAIANTVGNAQPAVAPAPSGKASPCTLPNGKEINAPEASGTSQQYYYYYYTYSWYYYSTYYYTYSYYGRKMLQSSSASAPSTTAKCCPTTTAKQGDTVSSLISAAGLPDDSSIFFYTINPQIANGTTTVPAGTVVTVPCFRITEYYRLLATNGPATAPVTTAGK